MLTIAPYGLYYHGAFLKWKNGNELDMTKQKVCVYTLLQELEIYRAFRGRGLH